MIVLIGGSQTANFDWLHIDGYRVACRKRLLQRAVEQVLHAVGRVLFGIHKYVVLSLVRVGNSPGPKWSSSSAPVAFTTGRRSE